MIVSTHQYSRNESNKQILAWFTIWQQIQSNEIQNKDSKTSSVFPQSWLRWPDFWLFTSINGCRSGWGCPCLSYDCGWFEWPSSGVVGFYDHEPSSSCSLWFHNAVWLRSVGCWPDPCRQSFRWLRMFETCVLLGKFSLNIKSIAIQFVVQYRICPVITFGLLTLLLRFWTSICCCWLDVLFQPRSSVCATCISLGLMTCGCSCLHEGTSTLH